MEEKDLSMQDFTRYFEKSRLGRLYFPNGKCFTPNGYSFGHGEITPFHIDLSNLYELLTEWKINDREFPLDDVVGVIAFGSAVRHPGYKEVHKKRRKYLLFGEEVTITKQVPIQPNDADFLVITGENLIREKVLEPVSLQTYDCGTWIKEGGIHLVNRGIEQVVNGIQGNDTVSASAMREGVPIFYDRRLAEVQRQTGISREIKRKIYWGKYNRGYLVGRIE